MTLSELCWMCLQAFGAANLFYLASTHPSLYTKNPAHRFSNLGYCAFRIMYALNLIFIVIYIFVYLSSHVSWR